MWHGACSKYERADFRQEKNIVSANRISKISLLIISFALLGSGCATSGLEAVEKAPAEASAHYKAVDATKIKNLSQEILEKRQAILAANFRSLMTEARSAVDRRQHRVAYHKYRSVKSMLVSSISILNEVKGRQASLRDRVEMARQIDKVQRQVQEVSKMIGLLDFSGRS